MSEKVDYKKKDKELYSLKKTPSIVMVPNMKFIMVDGSGNPNTCKEYKEAMELLYGLSYAIKMSKMGEHKLAGYFDYVVPPLEGFWSMGEETFDGGHSINKEEFVWTSFIRQPEFVTEEIFCWAKKQLTQKKPDLAIDKARFVSFEEGLCAQILHIGPYDDEPKTIRTLSEFIKASGYETDINKIRRHHEIYLGDPRKTAPEKLKTIIRHPIK